MVTIKDVAKQAQVSTATVSYVLNNTGQVSQRTREHVLKIVEELNYSMNTIAKTLRTSKSRTIGVIVEDMTVFVSPTIVDGVNQYVEEHDYHIIFSNLRLTQRFGHNFEQAARESRQIKQTIGILLSRQIDGIIYIGEHSRDVTDLLGTIDRPIVYTHCFTRDNQDYSINYDDYTPAYAVGEMLVTSGHRRIALLSGLKNSTPAMLRARGFLQALEDQGAAIDLNMIKQCDWEYESAHQAAGELFAASPRPTAVFAMNDLMALGVLDAAREAGLEVPRDVSIIGFDNREISRYCRPQLTTIEPPYHAMGEMAAEIMLQMLEGQQPQQRSHTLDCTFIPRASTGGMQP